MTTQLQGTAATNATTCSEHYSCTRPRAAWKGGSQRREQQRHVYAGGGIHVKATAAGGAARWPGRQVEAQRQQLWSAATAVTAMAVATGMRTGETMHWRAAGGGGWRHCQRGLAGGGRRSATALAHGEGVMGVYVWERARYAGSPFPRGGACCVFDSSAKGRRPKAIAAENSKAPLLYYP